MRIERRTAIAAALGVLGGVWLWATPGLAMNTKPMNLSELVRESNQIVAGNVTAVRQGTGANQLPYTEVDVKVSETLLGAKGPTLTFRQFGLQTALPAANGRKYVGLVAGMPQYKAGDHVVLFLGKVSPIGYRATIGLGQGKFELRGGNLQNETNNAGLFQNLNLGNRRLGDKEKSLVATTQGAVGADTFLGFVRRAVNEKWWSGPVRTNPRPRLARASTVPLAGTTAGGLAHE